MQDLLLAHYRGQARNNALCNLRLYRACALLGEEAYHAGRPSFFGSIHKHLDHILLVDERYLQRMDGRVPGPAREEGSLHTDLESLRSAQLEIDRQIVERTNHQTHEDLMRPVPMMGGDGQLLYDPLNLVWDHLFQHQIHHRGQVHCLLSQTGVAPPQLDETFLTIDRARREADLAVLVELGLPIG